MNKRLLKTILVLVSMLFLNIEAAQAGLVGKLKLYIQSEIPPQQLMLLLMGFCVLLFLGYIIFTPLNINNQKWTWYNYFSFQADRASYKKKKLLVNRINQILTNGKTS